MEPQFSAQGALSCHVCETLSPQLYCDLCHLNLCKTCAGEHLLDESKEHKVVSIKQRGSPISKFLECFIHLNKHCELYCEPCETAICVKCAASQEHKGHGFVDMLKKLESTQKDLQRELREFEKSVYPRYQEAASEIKAKKADLSKCSIEIKTALQKQGEVFHREINTIVQNLQSEVDETNSKYIRDLNIEENDINSRVTEIANIILELKKLLDSKDLRLISQYKSKISEFRKVPPQLTITLPNFIPGRIDTDQLYKQFGSLSKHSMAGDDSVSTVQILEADFSSPERPLLDEPRVKLDIHTDFEDIYSIRCLDDNRIWTCGSDSIMKLYNLQGELLESVETKDGNFPWDITLIGCGNLVYSYYKNRTVNIVKNGQIEQIFKLRDWNPRNICNTFAGDLLVFVNSYTRKQSKIVRFSGAIEKQNIQWDKDGQPLFSCGNTKYLCENKNLDVCVAARNACVVVVVNELGNLRFRYKGHISPLKGPFNPLKILISDHDNLCIHIIDQDGQFLRYIDTCDLKSPHGICVDSRDNLFVANTEQRCYVKKIQYYT